jgi:hypothetical protein
VDSIAGRDLENGKLILKLQVGFELDEVLDGAVEIRMQMQVIRRSGSWLLG